MAKANGRCFRCKGKVPSGGIHGNLFYCSEICRIKTWNKNSVHASKYLCMDCNEQVATPICMIDHRVEARVETQDDD